jgi:hypothetical protein
MVATVCTLGPTGGAAQTPWDEHAQQSVAEAAGANFDAHVSQVTVTGHHLASGAVRATFTIKEHHDLALVVQQKMADMAHYPSMEADFGDVINAFLAETTITLTNCTAPSFIGR